MDINLSGGLSFNEYLMKSTEEQRKVQKEMYEGTQLSQAAIEYVRQIEETIYVMFFSEGYCPDCVVALPFIKKLAEENNNIIVKIFSREGNKEKLEELVGTARIPTILIFNKDMEPKGAYIEFPKKLIEKMARLSVEEQKKVVNEYREGKYNSYIEQELIDILNTDRA